MKNLTIKDLARSEELDRTAMACVRGGWSMSMPSYKPDSKPGNPSYDYINDSSITGSQDLTQMQKVLNATANGSAFLHNIDVHNDVSQHGKNLIVG
jgi:hypothetical protein